MPSPLNIAVIYGSVRAGRLGIRAARYIQKSFQEKGHDVTLIDPLDYDLPLLEKAYQDYEPGQAPAVLEDLAEKYRAADAFVFVSGEYNHSIPPALKNLIDHFRKEFVQKVGGIVTYSKGPYAGVRAGVHLRVVLGEVGLVTAPYMYPIANITKTFDKSGLPLDSSYPKRIGKFIEQVEWYGRALKIARAK